MNLALVYLVFQFSILLRGLVQSWLTERIARHYSNLSTKTHMALAYNVIQLIFHLVLVFVELFWVPSQVYENAIRRMGTPPDPEEQWLYWVQIGFLIQTIVFQPQTSKVMWLHHATTLSVVLISNWVHATSIGIVVFFYHDISDIPVYGVRIVRLLEERADHVEADTSTPSNANFVQSMVCVPALFFTWLKFRLWDFFWFILACMKACHTVQQWMCIGMLWMLFGMHVFWFHIILTKVVQTIRLMLRSQ